MDTSLSESSTHARLLPVRNMDRALKFYTEALGGKLRMRGEGDMKDFWASIRVGKSEFWLVSPPEREKLELAYSVFIVKDIRAVVADMKQKGVKFQRAEKNDKDTKIEGPIAHEAMGSVAFFKDSEGNQLMLWQSS